MEKDYRFYCESDVKVVFAAYVRAIERMFGKTRNEGCIISPYQTITFSIDYSFKYNMNGGTCNINFAPQKTGTAITFHYKIKQLLGARCQTHASDIFNFAEQELSYKKMLINDDELLLDAGLKSNNSNTTIQKNEGLSSADEIKKYKDLLDCGVITQEEFDAKKKQLLGL